MGFSAVFLDRDGVLNEPILNPKTGEYESPHALNDLKIYPEVFAALGGLQKKFKLFVVSNQPSYAKGKISLPDLTAIEEKFSSSLEAHKIHISEFYYCHHHPEGNVPEYSVICQCRKPSPYFLKKAADDHDIDLKLSWMVGDRDTDIQCGQAAGCKTIIITNPVSLKFQGKEKPTYKASNIEDATNIILKESNV